MDTKDPGRGRGFHGLRNAHASIPDGRRSAYASGTQCGRSELVVGRRSTTILRSRGFFGVHAQSDVAACQQVVQGLQGVTRDLLLVVEGQVPLDRKSTRLNSSRVRISYAVFCLKKKKNKQKVTFTHNITHQYT